MREIWDYALATYSRVRAEEFVGGVHDAAEGLVDLPFLWRVREDFGGNRLLPVPPYFICYRVRGDTIGIVRIIHRKRDIAALLGRPRV